MRIDDMICSVCKTEYDNVDKDEPLPSCCGLPVEKNWSRCNCRVANRGQPINARLCNDGETINRFCAKDDPLTAIEVGLKRDNHSGIRTFSKEQADYYRAKIQREDSPKLRQEILDVRAKNESEKKKNFRSKEKVLMGV